MDRPVNRIEPAASAEAYKTYQIASPHDRMVRTVCEAVGCDAYRYGWETVVDEQTDLGRRQASFVRHQCQRTFSEQRRGDGLTVFRFDAHQRCFADHHTRPEMYLVRGGDWRGNPAGMPTRRHQRPQDWVEDFGEHQQRIAEQHKEG